MKGIFVDLLRNLRDTVRARRQEKLREVELTWSDNDLDSFRVFATGLQPAEMADVCYALADATALPLVDLLADYAEMNDDLRRIAFQSLDKTPMSAKFYITARLMASNNTQVRAATCDMLAGIGPEATEQLAHALSDPSSFVSTAAIRGLVKIDGKGAGEKIAALMKDDDADLCSQVLNAMIKMNIPAAAFETRALGIFGNAEAKLDIRRTAARALAAGKSVSGREAMLQAIENDPDLDIRRVAAEALGSFQDRKSAEVLLRALSSDSQLLVVAARQSLSKLDAGVKLELFRDTLRGGDAAMAATVASFLGEMDDKEAETLLCDTLAAETRPPVLLALADSLGKSGFPRAWDVLYDKLLAYDSNPMAILAALADAVDDSRLDTFAGLIDNFPGGIEAEFILRRLAAFSRAGKSSHVAEEKALEVLDIGARQLAVPAVEVLALSGHETIRKRLLSVIASHEDVLPIRRVIKAMLQMAGGEVAALFRGADPDASSLLPVAVEECEALGPGGIDFFVEAAGWAKAGRPGAREGIAAAAALDPPQLREAIPKTPDRAWLLSAWAGLDERERLRNSPDWNHVFDGCDKTDKLLILDILDRVKEEYHLRAVTLLAFSDPDTEVRERAVRIVNSLLWLGIRNETAEDVAEVVSEPMRQGKPAVGV